MSFVDVGIDFGRVPRNVLEWAIRKKGVPVVLVRSVMSLHEGVRMRVGVDYEFPKGV